MERICLWVLISTLVKLTQAFKINGKYINNISFLGYVNAL